MKKTRVYVEQSDVETKYYAQLQRNFFGIKYWVCIDIMGSCLESDAINKTYKVLDKQGVEYKVGSKVTAETLCVVYQDLYKGLKEDKAKNSTHNKTKKVWSYLFPEG